jgi:hypothetical protein
MAKTYSNVAKPELRPFSLSKKSVTISLRGSLHVRTMRDESETSDAVSKNRWTISSPLCPEHNSIMSPRYSRVCVKQRKIRRKQKVSTLRDDDSGSHERFFNMSNFEVAILGEICGVAVTHSTWMSVIMGAVRTSRI